MAILSAHRHIDSFLGLRTNHRIASSAYASFCAWVSTHMQRFDYAGSFAFKVRGFALMQMLFLSLEASTCRVRCDVGLDSTVQANDSVFALYSSALVQACARTIFTTSCRFKYVAQLARQLILCFELVRYLACPFLYCHMLLAPYVYARRLSGVAVCYLLRIHLVGAAVWVWDRRHKHRGVLRPAAAGRQSARGTHKLVEGRTGPGLWRLGRNPSGSGLGAPLGPCVRARGRPLAATLGVKSASARGADSTDVGSVQWERAGTVSCHA